MSGLESLRKQSWIRGLDTPAPGENLVPNRQAASFPLPPPCSWPAWGQHTLPRGCTISGEKVVLLSLTTACSSLHLIHKSSYIRKPPSVVWAPGTCLGVGC